MVVESLPPVLVAVTVYVADAVTAVGVPEIVPVERSNDRPDERSGETDQETTVPPKAEGVADVIAESLVKVNGLPL